MYACAFCEGACAREYMCVSVCTCVWARVWARVCVYVGADACSCVREHVGECMR